MVRMPASGRHPLGSCCALADAHSGCEALAGRGRRTCLDWAASCRKPTAVESGPSPATWVRWSQKLCSWEICSPRVRPSAAELSSTELSCQPWSACSQCPNRCSRAAQRSVPAQCTDSLPGSRVRQQTGCPSAGVLLYEHRHTGRLSSFQPSEPVLPPPAHGRLWAARLRTLLWAAIS